MITNREMKIIILTYALLASVFILALTIITLVKQKDNVNNEEAKSRFSCECEYDIFDFLLRNR